MSNNILKFLFRNIYTALCLISASALFVSTIIFDLEIFERIVKFLKEWEDYELDEWLIPVLVVFGGISVDSWRANARQQNDQTKVNVYRYMNNELEVILSQYSQALLDITIDMRSGHIDHDNAVEALDRLLYKTYSHLQRSQLRAGVTKSTISLALPRAFEDELERSAELASWSHGDTQL